MIHYLSLFLREGLIMKPRLPSNLYLFVSTFLVQGWQTGATTQLYSLPDGNLEHFQFGHSNKASICTQVFVCVIYILLSIG